MFLTIHATVGVIIGEQTNNIWLAFILSFIFHFLLDLISHGDKQPKVKLTSQEKTKKLLKMGTVDGVVMIITLLLFWQNNLINHPWPVLAGVIGGIIIDFLAVAYLVFSLPWLKKIYLLHKYNQDLKKKIEYPLLPGVIIQFIIFTLLIILLIKL